MLDELEADKTPLKFDIYSDPEAKTIKAFGVWDKDHGIALPSTMVLNRKGEVVWKFVADSVIDRPGEDELIEQLTKLQESDPIKIKPQKP